MFNIPNQKKYYNQQEIIHEINKKTKYPTHEITKILNSLGDIVKDKFTDNDSYIEIKLFKGLKIAIKVVPTEKSVSKRLGNFIKSDTSMIISANFSDSFRKEISRLRKQNV